MNVSDQNPTVAVMDVAVSAGSQEVTLTSTLNFKDRVEKILDIRANIRNIGYHIVGNKIIVQGMLHKQIFYMNNYGATKFQTEQLPFATFIELDGVQHNHHVRIEGRVEQIQRQLCRQGDRLKQKTTLVIEGTALEPRRYVIYGSHGYRYRIREVVARKECRIQESRQVLSRLPIQQIRSADVQINNLRTFAHANKVVVRGEITRRLEYTADMQNLFMEETYPVEYSFDVPGAKPGMYVVIQGENDGKLIRSSAPAVNKEGTAAEQEIVICFCMYVCCYKHLSLFHDEGPVMLLQKPAGEGTFTRRVEHEIELPHAVKSVTGVEGRLFDLEQELILDQMLIRGMVEYKIAYLSSSAQHNMAECILPFIVALDFAGADAEKLGEVKLAPLPVEAEIIAENRLRLSNRIQLSGQIFEEILMPVAAQQLQLI